VVPEICGGSASATIVSSTASTIAGEWSTSSEFGIAATPTDELESNKPVQPTRAAEQIEKREHGIAHFHAEYQGQQATFTLDGEVLAGALESRTARRLVKEWATAHQAELQANWNRLREGEVLERIAPLE